MKPKVCAEKSAPFTTESRAWGLHKVAGAAQGQGITCRRMKLVLVASAKCCTRMIATQITLLLSPKGLQRSYNNKSLKD